MGKKTAETHSYLLDMVTKERFEGLGGGFTFAEEGELLSISKGGFQKTLEFGLEENTSLALVSKLTVAEGVSGKQAVLELYVALRKGGKWRDYYDAIELPKFEKQAEQLAKESRKLVATLEEAIEKEGGHVLVVDGTNRPIENMIRLRADRKQMIRCKNLYMCLET